MVYISITYYQYDTGLFNGIHILHFKKIFYKNSVLKYTVVTNHSTECLSKQNRKSINMINFEPIILSDMYMYVTSRYIIN